MRQLVFRQSASVPGESLSAGQQRWRRAKRYRLLYLLLLFPLASLFIFDYIPIYGVTIAFKDYRFSRGILGSPWNDFWHFRILFQDYYFGRILRNTIVISLLRLGFGFPAPIILAILLNEVRSTAFKKSVQTISYLPYFMSWVVLASIVIEVFSPQRGLPAYFYRLLDIEPVPNVFTDPTLFLPMLISTGIWQGVGWGSIIYLAAMSSIDPELYESAAIDGVSRLQAAWHITVPSLLYVMVILFILQLGQLLNAGFDQIFNLYNPLVYEVSDIIDTYVYRKGFEERKYDFATAVGLFKNGVGVILIVGANLIIRRHSEYGLW